ncbi:hypothetical protein EGW08_004989 [Elysia chlorotica]|uniref:Magnesium transporter NIPA2 n=1 Tax=Elysia chlorotica TaxID=188477 RepID=A0A433U093_ELYCH|nr:hypothetical protein EGW08_004989 [Elysia chlorotica]
MWWAGMILMTLGEFVNFAAYAFAPATLVTPLGALSVIVSAILAARVLKERLNILGKVGCVLCVLGSTIMVIHSPKEQEVHDVEDLLVKMKEPGFIVYGVAVVLVASVMIVYFAPRYGQKNVLVYVTICATLGSFTVMGCKGVGVAIKATARGHNEFKNWLTYALLGVVLICILLQLNYLNKALDTFNTAVVTPIYYVFFTSCVIMGSAILFQEFFKMEVLDIIGDACGFLTIIAGIFLLNAFKDMKISWRNIPNASKTTAEQVDQPPDSSSDDTQDFMIGLCLAVIASFFTGASFIYKKLGLIRYARKVGVRAAKGGFGYLKEWMWWAGMILITLGELVNFAAYAFAPATLVTPLGALSVMVSAILAARVLKERLNILGKVGCVLCVLGSTLIVIHSPKEQEVHDVDDLMVKMKEPGFIIYGIAMVLISVVMIVYFVPRYGQKNVLVYVTICSCLGSLTVMGCKGVGVAITATARGHNEFTNWLTYVLLGVVVVCILLELNYLNKALDTFNTAVVTPINYVLFTSCVIIGSAILFQEFFKMEVLDIIGDACGFLIVIVGIFLLNAFKDIEISWKNIPSVTKPTKDTPETGVNNVEDDVFTNGTSLRMNGVSTTTSNCILDSNDIEARIARNMSAECITRNMSEESDCNDNNHPEDRYHGSNPIQQF